MQQIVKVQQIVKMMNFNVEMVNVSVPICFVMVLMIVVINLLPQRSDQLHHILCRSRFFLVWILLGHRSQ